MKFYSAALSAIGLILVWPEAESRIVGHIKEHEGTSTPGQPPVIEGEASEGIDDMIRSQALSHGAIDTETANDTLPTHTTEEFMNVEPEDQADTRTLRKKVKKQQARKKQTQTNQVPTKKQAKKMQEPKKQTPKNEAQPKPQAPVFQSRLTNKFYPGQKSCHKDCDPAGGDPACGGVVIDEIAALVGHVLLYDTPDECCESEFYWIGEMELCVARSSGLTIEKYYPDKINSKCALDADYPATDMTVSLYDTPEECCQDNIVWIGTNICVGKSIGEVLARTNEGTEEFYVDWTKYKCVQNCVGDPPCGGTSESWDILHLDSTACCRLLNKLNEAGLPGDDCILI